ncbi:hypothetical protein F0562_030282 [Nyssa sinensis]|uniref:Protein kinase domain-containing protein n=1 Tax=Nyssa sinensis TaxID=561372 RepID=A0A5J5AY40_9ASTE|nr:hypothetical protein F0562_030282 [Nyssa sinensis]
MTMAPSSHFSMHPNMVPPFVQPPQVRLDSYLEESRFGPRVVHLPGDQCYNTSQAQAPTAVVAGGYGCRQVPPSEQVVSSDGWLPHQQVKLPDKTPRFEDCYMCQKSLPHAHSDTVVQDQRESPSSTISNPNSVFHSLRMEDNMKAWPMNRAVVAGAVGEGGVEQHGAGARQRVLGHIYHEVATPQSEAVGVSQTIEGQCENQGIILQKIDNSDQTKVSFPQTVVGLAGGMQSPYGVYMNTVPQSCQENIGQQLVVPTQYQAKQDALNKPANSDFTPVGCMTFQTSDHMVHESPKDFSGKLPDVVPKEDTVGSCITYENLRPIDGRMENFRICPSEVFVNNEQSNSIHPHAMIGINYLSHGEVSYGNPAFSGVDLASITERIPASGELRDNSSRFPPKMVPSDVEAVPLNGNTPPSLSTSYRVGDIQDTSYSLFGNQDPWNLQHDTYFPPPRPNKIPMNPPMGNSGELTTEVHLEDGVCQSSGNPNVDFGSEHARPIKGSAEELIKQATSGTNHGTEVKTKMPEKINLGFPLSDGMGRLQIIKNSDLEELQELGSGTFGTVYHGKWRGSDVAIKRINDRCFAGKPSEQEHMRDDFWNEAINLADLHHPNVVAFYGVVLDGPGGSVATVTEYMVNGSLRNALQKNERSLDKRKRLLIAMDVAFGMEYLHGKNIVHFDLKSDNLLVNLRDPHRPICKVGDLGLSKMKCQTLISGGVRGTLPWMAPELLNGSSNLVSEKVDVFSFGIVMWELLTGEEPYADLHYGAIIGGIVSNTLRPPVPESCDPEWRSLMERCWSSEPSERPSFTEIANQLRSISAKIPLKDKQAFKNYSPIMEHDPENDMYGYEETFSAGGCGCFRLFCCKRRQSNGGESRCLLPQKGGHKETWLAKELKKAKEVSELVAGPKWKNLIRKVSKCFNKKKSSRTQFQYDPHSYALNFDDGRGVRL